MKMTNDWILPRALMIACMVALVTPASPAMAQGKIPKIEDLSEPQQELLVKKLDAGRRHYEEGQFAKALDSFEQAYRIFAHPDVLYRIAECQERLGRDEQAAANYRKFLDQSPTAKDRKRILGLIALLEDRVREQSKATIVIKSEPEGAAVAIDGEARGQTPTEIDAPGGATVTVTLTLKGYEPVEEKISTEKGKTVELRYPLKKRADVGPVIIDEPGPGPLPWIFTGIGGAAIVTSGVAFGLARQANNTLIEYDASKDEIERPDDYNELFTRRGKMNTLAIASASAAVVSFGIAGVLFTRSKPSEKETSSLQIAPEVAPGHAGARLRLRF